MGTIAGSGSESGPGSTERRERRRAAPPREARGRDRARGRSGWSGGFGSRSRTRGRIANRGEGVEICGTQPRGVRRGRGAAQPRGDARVAGFAATRNARRDGGETVRVGFGVGELLTRAGARGGEVDAVGGRGRRSSATRAVTRVAHATSSSLAAGRFTPRASPIEKSAARGSAPG